MRCVTDGKVTVTQTTHKARRQIIRQTVSCVKAFKVLNGKILKKKVAKI
jgi:hypothetical protein